MLGLLFTGICGSSNNEGYCDWTIDWLKTWLALVVESSIIFIKSLEGDLDWIVGCWATCCGTSPPIISIKFWSFRLIVGWCYSVTCEGVFNDSICWFAKETCLFWFYSTT